MPGDVGAPFSTVRLGGFRNQEPGIAVALTGLFTVKITGLEKVGFRKYYDIGIRVPWLLVVSLSALLHVGLEKPVANWAKHGEADAEEYPVLRRWRKKVSPVAGALRGHSS